MKLYANSYFVLRHARSTANEQGIVVSDPANGLDAYGLSAAGRAAARERLSADLPPLRLRRGDTLCFSSDFLRARETAEIFCEMIGLDKLRLDARLRERYFGELELGPHSQYARIWEADARDGDHHLSGCESPNEVAARVTALLDELETNAAGQNVVLISHGDTLQITQAIFRELSPQRHRELPHLENGELRRVSF